MYSPPPGFDDLLADAADWPVTGEICDLDVKGIGIVAARRPQPRAAAALAMTSNEKINAAEKLDHFTRFVMDHLGEGEFERIMAGMVSGELPPRTIQRVGRTMATWGTARPHAAVVTLSLYTGHNWRTIRRKLTLAGISNPMTLPSLHALLDVTEDIVVEALYASGQENEGPPSEGERKVRRFYDAIYAPDLQDIDDLDEEEPHRVPAGFENPDDVEADFDALLRAGH